jgi:hypothetical protein
MNLTLNDLENAIKKVIILNFVRGYIHANPDDMVRILGNIFNRKAKVFTNLARWAQVQIEKGHDPDKVVNSLAFYAQVLSEYVDKNLNQPLKK